MINEDKQLFVSPTKPSALLEPLKNTNHNKYNEVNYYANREIAGLSVARKTPRQNFLPANREAPQRRFNVLIFITQQL